MPKISVIVPVYKVSRFVERCARSLFCQSMKDVEYIFVDDCSPDNSMDIIKNVLKDYPERVSNVLFCRHEENKGLPTARKTGFQHSSGDYIAHCDSDDWVSPRMYELLYSKAQQEKADIVYCDFYKSNGSSDRTIVVPDYYGQLLQGPVWNKLVRRELYNDVVFPSANKGEDGAIMTQLSLFANKITVVHIPLYYYFDNPESICSLPSKEACINRWSQECENTDLRIAFLEKQGMAERYHSDIVLMKYYSLSNLMPYLKDLDVYHLWKNCYPEIKKEMGLISRIPLRVRVSYLLMRLRLVKLYNYLRKR